MDLPAAGLLVVLHDVPDGVGVEVRSADGQLQAGQDILDAFGGFGLDEPAIDGEAVGGHHPQRDGLPVQDVLVADGGFDGVPDRMPEVQVGPLAGLALVGGHDGGLDFHVPGEQVGERVRVAGEDSVQAVLDEVQQGHVADDAVLDALGQTVAEVLVREGREGADVHEHAKGLVEGADEVLARLVIDAGLASHGGVHVGEDGGGALHPAKSAQGRGGHEARQVAGHAAAEGDDHRVAVDRRVHVEQPVEDLPDRFERLVGLAGGELDERRGDVGAGQGFQRVRAVQRRDGGVGDHHRGRDVAHARHRPAEHAQQVRADAYVVTALAQVNSDGLFHPRAPARSRADVP